MCLPTMDGSHLKDVTGHMMPSASNVKSAPSAKRSKYSMISAVYSIILECILQLI